MLHDANNQSKVATSSAQPSVPEAKAPHLEVDILIENSNVVARMAKAFINNQDGVSLLVQSTKLSLIAN